MSRHSFLCLNPRNLYIRHNYYNIMSAPDKTNSREVKELLHQLKELHAPDRCEGPGNFIWRGMQKVAYMGSKIDQQKIEDYWKETKDITIHQNDLKKLASTALHDFYFVCRKVDMDRAVAFYKLHQGVWDILSSAPPTVIAIKQKDVNDFIDGSTEEKVQQMFDIMIVQWEWRTRMLEAWKIH